jgi:homogentisate 1,2-dioxygenase
MNNDLKMGLAKPRKSMDYFYKMLNVMNFYTFTGERNLKNFVGDLEFVTVIILLSQEEPFIR